MNNQEMVLLVPMLQDSLEWLVFNECGLHLICFETAPDL
jgi:hypothetical protein